MLWSWFAFYCYFPWGCLGGLGELWGHSRVCCKSSLKLKSAQSFNRTESLKPLLNTMPVFFNLIYPYSENMINATSNLRYWKVENLDVDNFTHVPSACPTWKYFSQQRTFAQRKMFLLKRCKAPSEGCKSWQWESSSSTKCWIQKSFRASCEVGEAATLGRSQTAGDVSASSVRNWDLQTGRWKQAPLCRNVSFERLCVKHHKPGRTTTSS